MKAVSLSLFVAVGVTLPAQSISVSVSALTPVTVRAQAGATQTQQVVAAGALPTNGGATAWPPSGESLSWLLWQSGGDSTQTSVSVQWTGGVSAAAPSFADTTMVDFVVTLTASSPILASISLHQTIESSPGTTITTNAMDLGNDGSFEVNGLSTAATLGPITLGAPLPIRVRMQASQLGQGSTVLTNLIHVLPWNGLLIQEGIPVGCAGDTLRVRPSFLGSGIALQSLPATPIDLAVGVLGLTMQPIQLPPATASCLLLPAAHLLVPLVFEQNLDLPLPASVRPLGFWAQAVVLSSSGNLTTTNSFFVIAL